jgi:acetoacetyl-CoA synthetase
MTDPIWAPAPQNAAASRLAGFMDLVGQQVGHPAPDYAALHRWSIAHPEAFWAAVWEFCDVIGEPGHRVVENPGQMPGARFFPDARLNFAENLLRRRDDSDAIVFWAEERAQQRLSWRDLHEAVARLTQALAAEGVGVGDRVVALMPNCPETVIAMLAATALGATWASCSPDFGEQGVLDRFGQIEPSLLFACDGYFYGGKPFDCLAKVKGIVAAMPSVRRVVMVPYRAAILGEERTTGDVPRAVLLDEFVSGHDGQRLSFAQVPFSQPLYILFSSGTTGVPKCIVHSVGGTLLQHMKEHQLQGDVRPADRLFYFTTCTWMMWNWLVSGLASEATLMLYEGSPFYPSSSVLFDFASAERFTHFGTSAKFIDALKKEGLSPARTHDLSSVRVILSTGSPLVAESFDYVYAHIKRDVCLASVSGGTDIVSCFVCANPISPVYRGEIAGPGLGMAVEVWNDAGEPVRGEKGELVCTRPFPSMPVGFWNDPGDARYRDAYFATFPGVWAHGDFAEITKNGGFVIYGRSDAVLNPGGVRIGTAEIYRQVEQIDAVLESVAIGQEWNQDVRVVLFVVLRPGLTLTDDLAEQIKAKIRVGASPRHVPAKIIQVADIPRTKSGKITELAVRDVVAGRPVKNQAALANPQALALYQDLPELAT